ncbi:MAG: hypothetical protein M0012_01490 [Deltaproteobacteria bacterium]|nr:hypothetical protein [Deltaproteobacteria bacterium]
MLKPLKILHTAKIGAIEDGILRFNNITAIIEPKNLINYCKRSLRGFYIYTFDDKYLNYFVGKKIDNITIKTVYSNSTIMFVKLTSKRNILTIVNASFMFPKQPPNLFNALFYLYNTLGKGILPSYTPATFALRLWRLKFQKEALRGISFLSDRIIRQAYAGGRSEIIKSKLNKGYYYDINSMYADMMRKDMPVGRICGTLTRTEGAIGFYKCEVNQSKMNLPPLWQKIHNDIKSKDMLCFPKDEFIGIFDGDEIDNAIKVGTEVKILGGIEWEDKKPIFKEFIEYLYDLREKTQFEWFEAFLKKVLVSFYGKFAENKDDYRQVVQCKDIKNYNNYINDDNNKTSIIDDDNLIIEVAKKIVKYNRNNYNLPHFSAHIAALGRIEIYNQAIKADAAYIETDALFTSKKLKTGTKLGNWKLIGKIKNAEFKLCKTYSYEMDGKTNYVAAGISDKADKSVYFQGESIKIYKKQKFIEEKKEYNMKMKNTGFIKRDIHDNFSLGLTIQEILNRMKINNPLFA